MITTYINKKKSSNISGFSLKQFDLMDLLKRSQVKLQTIVWKLLNFHTIALISQASNLMLKILQARLQQYMNRELPDDEAGFRKGRGTRDQIANIRWIIEKASEF